MIGEPMKSKDELMAKAEKKSDVLEVRLPYETKKKFMDACKAHDETASEVLRRAIRQYLVGRKTYRLRERLLAGALLASLGLASFLGYFSFHIKKEMTDMKAKQVEALAVDKAFEDARNLDIDELLTVTSGTQITNLKANQTEAQAIKKAFEKSWDLPFNGKGYFNPLVNLHFDKFDKDKDGRLTLNEFAQSIAEQGSVSSDDIPDDYTMLRVTGVGLTIPQGDAKGLEQHSMMQGCFDGLREIGKAQQLREFYALDLDGDNQLSRMELSESERIPSYREMRREFRAKDANGDGQLTYEETLESIDAWQKKYVIENNQSTQTVVGKVPEACKNPEREEPQGMLTIKFEMLKRFVLAETQGSEFGPSGKHFNMLDVNGSQTLNFKEFVAWYNRGLNDFIRQ